MSATSTHQSEEISTLIPARLERLPWGRFHVLVIAALGITWILDGLEVTLAGSVAPALKESPALHFSDSEVGLAGSAYLLGAVVGALFFGWLTDRLGRKMLFFITIFVYLIATALTGLSLERPLFLRLSLLHRLRHRRRIFRHQFDHPGTGPRALPRPTRSHDQRQFLGRRGARRGGRGRAPQSGADPCGMGMAACVPDRRDPWPRRLFHADVGARESALARDPWARERGRGRRQGYRKAI